MATVDNCLLFYLKYPVEMDRLYWQPRVTGEKPVVSGLQNADEVLTMVQRVGDTACRGAARFLQECADQVEPNLQSVCTAKRIRRNQEERWELAWWLTSKGKASRTAQAGIWINEEISAIVPWIWSRGGRRAEDEIVRILGRGTVSRAAGFDVSSGTVALDRIDIAVGGSIAESCVEQEALVKRIHRSMTFSSKAINAIAAIPSRNGD